MKTIVFKGTVVNPRCPCQPFSFSTKNVLFEVWGEESLRRVWEDFEGRRVKMFNCLQCI